MTQREHQVRERAYYIWEGEGRVLGRAEAHWLQAEREILACLPPAPLLVQVAAPDLTLAPSPAKVLAETLKAKPSRRVTAQAEAKVKVSGKRAAEKAEAAPETAKVAEAVAQKSTAKSTSKPAAVKAETVPKSRAKVAARPRASEAAATVH